MSDNSQTPTEESTKISSNNEYDNEFEEEEEEYQTQYEDFRHTQFQFPYSRYKDPRDKEIIENQRKIRRMQKEFKREATRIRASLAEICEQSSKLQFELLERIIELKQKIKEVNERNDFRRRAFPSRTKIVKKKVSRKKSKSKKRTNTKPQLPEPAYEESGESF